MDGDSGDDGRDEIRRVGWEEPKEEREAVWLGWGWRNEAGRWSQSHLVSKHCQQALIFSIMHWAGFSTLVLSFLAISTTSCKHIVTHKLHSTEDILKLTYLLTYLLTYGFCLTQIPLLTYLLWVRSSKGEPWRLLESDSQKFPIISRVFPQPCLSFPKSVY